MFLFCSLRKEFVEIFARALPQPILSGDGRNPLASWRASLHPPIRVPRRPLRRALLARNLSHHRVTRRQMTRRVRRAGVAEQRQRLAAAAAEIDSAPVAAAAGLAPPRLPATT